MAPGISGEIAGESKLYDYEFSDEIPVISLSGIDDVGRKKEEICGQIVEACEKWGMFQAVDHGVDTNLMVNMTRLARDFFALTTEEKLRFHMSGGEGGFSISSHLQGEAMKDWREVVVYLTYPVSNRDYSHWADKPEGWLKVTAEYSERLMGLAYKVLAVLSEAMGKGTGLAMGLEKDALKNACVDMEQKIFVTYFPKRSKPDLALGMRHTDNGIITLLLQDQFSCLQVTRDNGKTWVRVPFVPGALVINLGDIGHYLSNGRFMTTDHQGVVDSNSSKLFINTFLFLAPHDTVYPLKVRDGEKAKIEEPISYEAITMRKLKDL
uniref:Naringenin,2-oxoglutarate 3-dioxygenase n=1 Tax=Brassica campestris TaxID=3711 RepID=M4DEB0_BRACM